jgi:hypothetical protein
MVDAYIRDYKSPKAWQLYEGLLYITEWKKEPERCKDITKVKRWYSEKEAIEACYRSLSEYIDIHCWAWTLESFLKIVEELKRCDLWDFDVIYSANRFKLDGQHANEFCIQIKPNKPAQEIPSVAAYVDLHRNYHYSKDTKMEKPIINNEVIFSNNTAEILTLQNNYSKLKNEFFHLFKSYKKTAFYNLTRLFKTKGYKKLKKIIKDYKGL